MTTPTEIQRIDVAELRDLIRRERATIHLAIHGRSIAPWLDRLEIVLNAVRPQHAASWTSDQPGGHIDQAIQLANSGK